MKPFVRLHYPDADNRVKIEIQWPSPDLMKIAHEANFYKSTRIPYAFFWFDADSNDLIDFLEVFPPNEVRENPLTLTARLNGVDDTGSNDDLADRLHALWSEAA